MPLKSNNMSENHSQANSVKKERDVTTLLYAAIQGDGDAAEELANLIYPELHKLASKSMSQQDRSHTLQPTALVNEMWIKFEKANNLSFKSRARFLGFASDVMRKILVDYARRKNAGIRGGGKKPENIDEMDVPAAAKAEEVLELHEALDLYATHDPYKARLIHLHYFGGLTNEELASEVKKSLTQVKRDLAVAKAHLRLEIEALRRIS